MLALLCSLPSDPPLYPSDTCGNRASRVIGLLFANLRFGPAVRLPPTRPTMLAYERPLNPHANARGKRASRVLCLILAGLWFSAAVGLALAPSSMLASGRPPTSSFALMWKESKQGSPVTAGLLMVWSCRVFTSCATYYVRLRATPLSVMPIHVEKEQAGFLGYYWLACGLVFPLV